MGCQACQVSWALALDVAPCFDLSRVVSTPLAGCCSGRADDRPSGSWARTSGPREVLGRPLGSCP